MSGALKTSTAAELVVAELTTAVGQLLRRLRAETSQDGLSWSQTAVLSRLLQAEALSTAELARLEVVKPQSMGATLAELEAAGLVTRRAHPSDRRKVLFSITARGREARARRTAAKQAWLMQAAVKLDTQELQTLAAASALLQRLSGTAEPVPALSTKPAARSRK